VRKAIKSDIFTQVDQYWRENMRKSFQQTVSLSYCDQLVEFMKIYCCDCKLALCTKCFIQSIISFSQHPTLMALYSLTVLMCR